MYSTLGRLAFREPETLGEASALLVSLGPGARIVAGGCDLLPAIRRRAVEATDLVSLLRVRGLGGVQLDAEELRIGASASLLDVQREQAVKRHFQALHEGVSSIASVQVRATGTLVGNLCVATPASDIAPPLMVLDARLRVVGPSGEREMRVEELFAGAKRTTLARGELVLEVRVRRCPAGSGSAFAKLTRTAADIAKINTAAFLEVRHGVCTEARIVLGSVAAVPLRSAEAEAALRGRRIDDDALSWAAQAATEHLRPIDDLRSTATYRKEAMAVLVRRVLRDAAARAAGGAP